MMLPAFVEVASPSSPWGLVEMSVVAIAAIDGIRAATAVQHVISRRAR